MKLEPEKPAKPSLSRIAAFNYDRSVERVVVLGNGIAGVTAADHVRRRHPMAQIDLVAEESHHLYNRMGIGRLIYGRSAMQGLYLNPEKWYDEHAITPWLNTRARGDRPAPAGGAPRHGREAPVRPADPRHRLELVRARRSTASARRARSCCGRPTTRSACARSPSATARSARSWPAAGCSASRRPTRCTSSGCARRCSSAATGCCGASSTPAPRRCCRPTSRVSGWRSSRDAETVALDGNGRVNLALLADDRALEVDVFLAAAGITPNAGLAKSAGLAVNRGVLVDERMRTMDYNILAAGDVAEHAGPRARAVAGRGRAGRGRGRQRGRRRQGVPAARSRSRCSRSSASS